MRNERGSISILALFLIIVLLILLAFTTDIAGLQATKIHARHGLNLALRAASAQIDLEAFNNAEDSRVIILEPDARVAFDKVLKDNLRLDNAYMPYAGSVADGKVEVLYFQVLNEEKLPYSYSWGSYTETINQISCTGIIKVPIRLSPLGRFTTGLPEYTELLIHSTVGPDVVGW